MSHGRLCRRVVGAAGWLAAGVLVAGCGPARPGTSPGTLVGARFDIPVYPGARVVSQQSLLHHKEEGANSVASFDTVIWRLSTTDRVESVIAYYKARLPEARRVDKPVENPDPADDPRDSTTEFEYRPPEGNEGDTIVISVGEEGLEIRQITRRE